MQEKLEFFFLYFFNFFSNIIGMHHMQPHAAPAPPMPQMEMDEPPNKKARGKLSISFFRLSELNQTWLIGKRQEISKQDCLIFLSSKKGAKLISWPLANA